MSSIGAVALLAAVGQLSGQALFEDATAESGLTFVQRNSATDRKYLIETMPGGVAVLDYDRDGWMDLFFVNGAELDYPQPQGVEPKKSSPDYWNRLYRNDGAGGFQDVTEAVGLQGRGYGMGVAVGDIDNDGFPDLAVTQAATGEVPAVTLYRNDAGRRFIDITSDAGLLARGWATSAGFFDYDLDGDLDLFVGRYMQWRFDVDHACGLETPAGRTYCHPDLFEPISNLLFRNEGNLTFSDVTAASGIADHPGKALGVAFADFDRDGDLDIAVANDSHPQFLFLNHADGSFSEEGTLSGCAYDADGREFAGMGIVADDLDGDGHADLLITALSQQRYAFFRNLSAASFEYRSEQSGLGRITRLFSGWGLSVADFDRDGRKEVFVANGHVMDNIERSQPHVRYLEPPMLLRYVDGRFSDISASAGDVFETARAGRGLAAADLDNDGDLDVVVSNLNGRPYLARNRSAPTPWVGLDLRGRKSNADAIGAQLELTRSDGVRTRAVVARAASYLSSQDRRIFWPLPNRLSVKNVRIVWPSGIEQDTGALSPGKIHVIDETQTSH